MAPRYLATYHNDKNIYVKFIYQGHRVKVNVTGAKKRCRVCCLWVIFLYGNAILFVNIILSTVFAPLKAVYCSVFHNKHSSAYCRIQFADLLPKPCMLN